MIFSVSFCYGQKEDPRIFKIRNQLTALSVDVRGLTENVKTEIQVNNVSLANFLLAVSEIHDVNINVASDLNQPIKNNFSNVTVADLLVFLCKEYKLAIDFTGNILSVKSYVKIEDPPEKPPIPITYDPSSNTISIDANGDKLYDVFRKIINESGKNLVFSPELGTKSLTVYLKETPFENAMDKLAFANDLIVEQSKDGFFLFENNAPAISVSNPGTGGGKRPARQLGSNFIFKVKNLAGQLLEVDFINAPIVDIINEIAAELQIDIFTATPLQEAGNATLKAKNITFDDLLKKLFQMQNVVQIGDPKATTNRKSGNAQDHDEPYIFSFKKEGNIYFFGTNDQLSVRRVEIVQLQHRSIEILTNPSGSMENRNDERNQTFNSNGYMNDNQYDNFQNTNRPREPLNTNANQPFGNDFTNKAEALISILPDEIIQDLDIKVDFELNSFYVNGPSMSVERFKDFIAQIDKPIPVVLIEVMLIEVNNNSIVETGVSWGLGEGSTTTQGSIFPEADIRLNANSVNRILGGFSGFSGINLGKVASNFFANIKALEANGDINIRSTPKLSTLNGHRAYFSNGQTSYYTVTQRNIYGTNNPQTSEITNYHPIDAELGLTIKPLVSGDGQVTLDISVIQSSFGSRISEDAPPDISSREFSSIIRMKDQDIAILGGLEEQMTNDSGSGVPFLARIPIIKYLFSKRTREARKSKLTVLIKPTVIY